MFCDLFCFALLVSRFQLSHRQFDLYISCSSIAKMGKHGRYPLGNCQRQSLTCCYGTLWKPQILLGQTLLERRVVVVSLSDSSDDEETRPASLLEFRKYNAELHSDYCHERLSNLPSLYA